MRLQPLLNTIRKAWGWTGLKPAAVVAANRFGNVIVRAKDGVFWRICPEELSCEVVAHDARAYKALWTSDEFQDDWQMARVSDLAEAKLGMVDEHRCYCLKLPAVLGGEYSEGNLGTISRREVLAFAGHVAEQIKDVPDGATVKFGWTK